MARQQDEILDALKALGLTQYESKVYLALLRQGHSTAREVAEASGVPRPKVYETLERLVTACLAVVHTTDPLSYVPLPLDDFLASCKDELDRRSRFLRESAAKLVDTPLPDAVIKIVDQNRILDRMAKGIDGSRRSIHFHLFKEEAQSFREALISAHGRGVRLVGIAHGQDCGMPGEIYSKGVEGMNHVVDDFGRPTLMVFDESEALGGWLDGAHGSHAIYTRNPIIVRLALTCLGFDVLLGELESRGGQEFQRVLQHLREKSQTQSWI